MLIGLFAFGKNAAAANCIVTTPIGGGDDVATAVAVQLDGKIVVAGYSFNGGSDDFAVVRYNPDLSLDLSFSTDGIVTTDFAGGQDRAKAIAIQPDGKIVVAGFAGMANQDFAIARYNLDGSLDPSFGAGGKVTTDITGSLDEIESIAIDGLSRIVVAGSGQLATTDYVVARYDTLGSLDTATFGAPNGYFISTNGLSNDAATSVALQTDGRIVIAGWANSGVNDDFLAARFDTNGALDGRSEVAPSSSPSARGTTEQTDCSSSPTGASSFRERSAMGVGSACSVRRGSIRSAAWT